MFFSDPGISRMEAREWLFKKYKGKCFYCRIDLTREWDGLPSQFVIDHLTPVKRGGDNSKANLVACCNGCNSKKRNKNLVEFVDYLKKNGQSIPSHIAGKIGGLKTKYQYGKAYFSDLGRKGWPKKNAGNKTRSLATPARTAKARVAR